MVGNCSFITALIVIFKVASLASALLKTPPLKFNKNDNVQFFDMRLPVLEVPAKLTTYTCYAQQIPLDLSDVYYAIAFEPLVDNVDVLHHMIMFGCDSKTNPFLSQPPHHCDGADNSCRNFVVQWSMGIRDSFLSPPHTGVQFGRGSIVDTFSLQIHWNNAQLINGTTDSSGFRVYYTKKPRRFPLGNVQIGQNDLEIPAHSVRLAQTGGCSSDCTSRWLTHPIYLTRAHVHMHYLGSGGVLELVRGSKVIQVLRDETYNYTTPHAHSFSSPVEVLPGDELRLTCYFNSKDGVRRRNRTIFWGEGSDGEMCYAFITYYPLIEHFDQCIQFDKYDICSTHGFASLGECVFGGFIRAFRTGIADEILQQCLEDEATNATSEASEVNLTNVDLRLAQTGGPNNDDVSSLCSRRCDVAVREFTEHPCMQDRLGRYAKRKFLPSMSQWPRVEDVLDQRTAQCQN